MLDGIETGYEGKFDFPQRGSARPERTYLLAAIPRTGSTWLSHLLWRTGCLGAPLEYLNFEPAGPFGFAANAPEVQQRLWRSLLFRRTSPNGVFGLKAFPMQVEALVEANPPLLASVLATMLPQGREKKILYLRRRDRAAHVVSYARALTSGVWRQEQEGVLGGKADYSDEAVAAAERLIDVQERIWEKMFADLAIEPLALFYEDVVADDQGVVARAAAWLGVQLDPAAGIEVPEVRKQSESDAILWAGRYARSRKP
jgi:LPS sulfotransferase NodH